jgi:hypothetical protein
MNGLKTWIKTAGISAITLVALVSTAATSRADLASLGVDLGWANNMTVFALSNGVTISGGTKNLVDIKGNVASAGAGVTISDYVIVNGSVYIRQSTNAKFQKLDSSKITGSVIQSTADDIPLINGSTDASEASANAFSLSSTVGYPSSIDLNGQNLSLSGSGNVVLNLKDFDLTNAKLTLSGDANTTFVFNITKDFNLNKGSVLLTGGLTAANVLFNVANSVSTVILKNSSLLTGTILASKSKVTIDSSKVIGKVIGKQVIISGKAPAVVSP